MNKVYIIIISLIFASCAGMEDEVNLEKQETRAPASRQQMNEKTKQIIMNSKDLTSEQKLQFSELHERVVDDISTIKEETYKLKIILFNNLSASNYNERKTKEIIKQLKKLNDKKFKVMSNALIKSREILGFHIENQHGHQGRFENHFDL